MRLIAATLVVLLGALPAAAEKLSLKAVSTYLNGLQSTKGAFTQINDDGSISTGEIAIKRPGRMRFDYNPPERALVLVSGGSVAIFDRKSSGGPEQYPIGQTPLKIILQKNVNLRAAGIVVGHSYDGTSTKVTAQDPAHPEYGTIEMVFTDNPVELRQWIVRDDAGTETTVILGDMDKRARLSNLMFSIQNELSKLNR